MVPESDLLTRIEKFVAATGMSPWAFGRAAIKDTNLIDDLRAGRELRRATRERVEQYMHDAHKRVEKAVRGAA